MSVELKLHAYLANASNKGVTASPVSIEQFGAEVSQSIARQFAEPMGSRKFTIRMSSIGRPLCQQQAEKMGWARCYQEYFTISRFVYGDFTESYIMFLMRNAGVNIEAEQQKVALKIGGIEMSGTLDVVIDGKVYDIKSCSDYVFNNKFGERGGFAKIAEDDNFGYIPQLYLYSEATGLPVGGWIVLNKNSGKMTVLSFPEYDTTSRKKALAEIERKIAVLLDDNAEFKRCFEPETEYYYRKPTGNKVLPIVCVYCPYRESCWPDAKYMPSPVSSAKTPPWKYYTQVSSEWT